MYRRHSEPEPVEVSSNVVTTSSASTSRPTTTTRSEGEAAAYSPVQGEQIYILIVLVLTLVLCSKLGFSIVIALLLGVKDDALTLGYLSFSLKIVAGLLPKSYVRSGILIP